LQASVNAESEARIRDVIAIARRAGAKGNAPFAALLVADDGSLLAQAENRQATDEHVLAHAEVVLLHDAVRRFDREQLAGATIYTSAEPLAMCAGAIFWSGIRRLVFGLSGERLFELMGEPADMLVAGAREVLACAGRQVEVTGPVLQDEAIALFQKSAPG